MKIPLTQRNNTQAKLYIEKPNSSGNINRFYISDVAYSYEPTDTISRFGNAQRVTPEGLLIFVFNDKKEVVNNLYSKDVKIASNTENIVKLPESIQVLSENICDCINQIILGNGIIKQCYIEKGKFKVEYERKGKLHIATQPLQ
jgi:hypothetical protein